MRTRWLASLLFVFTVTCPWAQAADLSVSGLKLSDPQFLTLIEVSDVAGVMGARARAADGTNITLTPAGPDQFALFLDPFSTFSEFRAATTGNWRLTLEFVGGAAMYDFVVNDFHTPFTEADFPPAPTMLSPTDGAAGVSSTPTFLWNPGGPHTGPLESLFVSVSSLVDPTAFAVEGSFGGSGLTLASSSWTPPLMLPAGPATFLVQYETNGNEDAVVNVPVFNAAASTIADPGIVWESTSGDLFARDLITFTVVPESSTVLLLTSGLIPAFILRLRSRKERIP
jgi:hypothetical protein